MLCRSGYAARRKKHRAGNLRGRAHAHLPPVRIERKRAPLGRHQVAAYAVARIGQQYDLRNIADLARYLLPTPPIPSRFRRHLLTLGSGDPTRAICSTLIAQSFQSIRYPILPVVQKNDANSPSCPGCIEEIYKLRHHSLFTPRDFDVSPYFQIVKPTQTSGFNFHKLTWEDIPG